MGIKSEFQVVLYCDSGDLDVLVDPGNFPKPFLPTVGRPLIHYGLDWLERNGFEMVIVVSRKGMSRLLSKYFTSQYAGNLIAELVFVDDHVGGFEAVYQVRDKLHGDFIVMYCDAFLNNVSFIPMAEQFRIDNPMLVAVVGEQIVKDHWCNVVGYDSHTKRLLFLSDRDSLDMEIGFPFPQLKKFPKLELTISLKNLGCYLFGHRVLDWWVPACEAQRGTGRDQFYEMEDFVSWILGRQWKDDPIEFHCMIYALPSDGFGCRANCMKSFAEINHYVAKTWIHPRFGSSSRIAGQGKLGAESVVGEHTTIGNKCLIKKSVVGSHCLIGNKVKLDRSIIMDHVVLKDQVELKNVIVASHAEIGEASRLSDSCVGFSARLGKKTMARGESFSKETNLDEGSGIVC